MDGPIHSFFDVFFPSLNLINPPWYVPEPYNSDIHAYGLSYSPPKHQNPFLWKLSMRT